MKIRTQLILAFVVLAVLPLTAIVLYSYFSSIEAVREAYEEEASALTQDMNVRIASVRNELDEAIDRAGSLPAPVLVGMFGEKADPALELALVEKLGGAAPLVDRMEFVPHAAPPAPPPPALPETAEPAEPAPAAVAVAEPGTAEGEAAAESPRQPTPRPPVVIDVQAITRAAQRTAALSPEARAEMERAVRIAVEEASRLDADALAAQIRSAEEIVEREMERLEEAPDPRDASTEASKQSLRNAEETLRRNEAILRMREEAERARANAEQVMEHRIEAIDDETERVESLPPTEETRQRLTALRDQKQQLEERHSRLILGRSFEIPVRDEGKVIGVIKAQLSGRQLVESILGSAQREEGEIPFAIDATENLYTATERDRERLQPIRENLKHSAGGRTIQENWVVVSDTDPESGLTYGIARPIREPLRQVRETAARNFGYGLALIGFALFGIIPLANHMTRDLEIVRSGAERIAQGDLQTRLPVRSNNEIGQLANAFNSMARDLSLNQQQLIEQERMRQEQQIQQKLLEVEYVRKTSELEEARRFQLSLLPKEVPNHPSFAVAVEMRTATEVGGDYYDFHQGEDGSLTVALGDATGHGARAATMVTVLKSLFAGGAHAADVSEFLTEAAETIRRMDLGRMAMAFSLSRILPRPGGASMDFSAAGMPPLLIFRAAKGVVEEVLIEAMPLGTLSTRYEKRALDLRLGDTALLMTDGFPELLSSAGEPLGYQRAADEFGRVAASSPQQIIEALFAAAERWTAGQPPNDDITFVVLSVRAETGAATG